MEWGTNVYVFKSTMGQECTTARLPHYVLSMEMLCFFAGQGEDVNLIANTPSLQWLPEANRHYL